MSTLNHTPGPWSVWVDDNQLQIRDERYILLAIIRPSRQHADANASLVAAAPDMLAALEAFVAAEESFRAHGSPANYPPAEGDSMTEAYEKARAAIKAAKGDES